MISDGGDAFGNEERLARERDGVKGAMEKEREIEERRKEDGHVEVERYIGEQMSRIRIEEESVAVYEDEFEAQLD